MAGKVRRHGRNGSRRTPRPAALPLVAITYPACRDRASSGPAVAPPTQGLHVSWARRDNTHPGPATRRLARRPRDAGGAYPAEAYRAAFAVLLALEVAGIGWYLLKSRAKFRA